MSFFLITHFAFIYVKVDRLSGLETIPRDIIRERLDAIQYVKFKSFHFEAAIFCNHERTKRDKKKKHAR
jgi:hypothetical protein